MRILRFMQHMTSQGALLGDGKLRPAWFKIDVFLAIKSTCKLVARAFGFGNGNGGATSEIKQKNL